MTARGAATARAARPLTGRRRPALASALAVLGVLAALKSGLLLADLGEVPDAPAGAPTPAPTIGSEAPALPEPEAGPPAPAGVGPTTAAEARPGGELDALQSLAARRAALDERERELELRTAVLETAEARLNEQLKRLNDLRAALQARIDEHEAEEAAKIASLVKIYETMKPKAAAEIFDRLEMGVLVEVVSRMSENKASGVIARMEPTKAKALTTELARREDLPRLDR